MSTRWLIAALLALSLVGPALVAAPTAGSPQPVPVCGACGPSFEQSAWKFGLNATVSRATATVRVHANGSTTWVVTNRVDEATADQLRTNRTLLLAVANRTTHRGRGIPIDDPSDERFLTASIEGRTVTVRFRDPDGATRGPGGYLAVGYLHGHSAGFIVNAETVTFVGPPGTTVTNDPTAATVDGRRAVWHGSVEYEWTNTHSEDTFVVYGPTSAWVTTPGQAVATTLAAFDLPPWPGFVMFVLPFVAAVTVVLGSVAALFRWRAPVETGAWFAIMVAGLGAVAGVVTFVLDGGAYLLGVSIPLLVAGGVTSLAARGRLPAWGRTPWLLPPAVAVGVALVVGLARFGDVPAGTHLREALLAALWGGVLASTVPLAWATRRSLRETLLGLAGVGVGAGVVLTLTLSLAQGGGLGFVAVLTMGMLVFVALGLLFTVLGTVWPREPGNE